MVDLPARFRVERTMGDVCEAVVVADGTKVAIKTLGALDAAQRGRFLEIGPQLLALHENVVRVLECGGDFLVMELVDKPRTLADALGQPFAPERACLIAFQILAALEAALPDVNYGPPSTTTTLPHRFPSQSVSLS